ncbi:transcriptional regulator [Halostella sp. JP-L12]|uniref:thiamine-phosphate synthase family protein n=1 Tax=Halostella TaxID=1843185 RepID=UPI000EF81BB3|nr:MULTISPECIES: thiamine-phosphate synthase family protein [Halostella]NHN47097.1 transcriptional regulator [Halostella sp. JP-L12]
MSLRLPSEIVVEQFLPTARAMLAAELDDHDLTQQEIADYLGVTQAAVSKYVGGEAPVNDRFADHPRMRETTAAIADGLATGEMDQYEALAELLELVREFEDRGPICEAHEEAMPALRGLGCDLCVRGPDEAVLAEREVLSTVREATRTLQAEPAVVEHVPNVGTNVGTALPDAVDETDVAAVPGRIHAMRGGLNVPANPEFGASQHVAEAILAARAVDPAVGGALNLATSDALLSAAREAGIEPLEFDADYEDRGERLREHFAERGAVPPVIYHRGAFGVEPITYVLGETAAEAAALAADLATAASRE